MIVLSEPASLRDHVGRQVGVSDWVHIYQARIDRFADVTEDWQWMHLDAVRAATESPADSTAAHGFPSLSLLSRFVNAIVCVEGARSIVAVGLTMVRFITPSSWAAVFVAKSDFAA